MTIISREPTLLSSDIAVDSKPLKLQSMNQKAYQSYHRSISPDVAKLMKTSHFQEKVREVIPRRDFALSTNVQVRVKENGTVLIREKDGDAWIKIYKKSEIESPELDEPIDEIVRKTREAYNGLFPHSEEKDPKPLTSERISSSSPPCHHCCSHHHSPDSLQSRDELIRDLREEVRELRREIERLKETDSRPPVTKVVELEHGLRSTTSRIETLPDMEPTLLVQNKELRRQKVEIDGLREDLTQANQHKAALLLLLSAASECNKSLRSQLQTTAEDLGITEETLGTVMDELDRLQREKGVVENTLQERTEQLSKMLALFLGTAALYQQSQLRIADLQDKASRLDGDNEALEQNLEKRTKELQGAVLLLALASGLHKQNQHQLQTLRELHGKVSEERNSLALQLELAQQEVEKLSKVELPEAHEAKQRVEKELEDAKQQVEDLTPKLKAATERIAQLEDLLLGKDKELQVAKEATQDVQRKLDEAHESHARELKDLREEFGSAKKRLISENEEQVRKLTSSHAEDLEQKLLDQKLKFDEESRLLTETYQEKERKLTEQHGLQVHQLEEQVKDLGSKLEAATKRAEKAERLLEEKGSELSSAREDFEEQLRLKGEEVRLAKVATEDVQQELEKAHESHARNLEQVREEFGSAKKRLTSEHEEQVRKLTSLHAEDLDQKLDEQRRRFEEASKLLTETYQEKERKLTEQHGLQVHQLEEQVKDLGSKLEAATKRAEEAERLLKEKGSELSLARKDFEEQLRLKSEEVRLAKVATEDIQQELEKAHETHKRELERLREAFTSDKRELSRREEELTQRYDLQVHELETKLQKQKESFEEAFTKLDESYQKSETHLKEEFGLALRALGVEKKDAEARAEELQERVKELEEILREAHDKVSKLPISIAEDSDPSSFPGKYIVGKIKDLLDENQRLNLEMSELKEELLQVRKSHGIELEKLDERHRKELEKFAKEHQSKIQAIQSEIAGYTSEIERLLKKTSDLTAIQLSHKQKIKELEDINHELRAELSKTDQRDISQKSTIDTLKSKISRIEKESTEKDQALEEANSDILKRRAEIEELKRSMKQRDKEIQEAGEELSGMTEDRNYLQGELIKEKKKVRLAEERLLSTEERASRLEQELNEKKQVYDRLTEETEIALANMEREARKSSSEYEAQILELTSALKEKSQKVLELENENRVLCERVEKQDKELEELRKEVQLLRRENRELWSILERLAIILNVTFERDNLETTGQSILEGIKTSAFAKGALGEIADHIGLEKEADATAIHKRLEELIQAEKKNELRQKEETERLLKKVEELEDSSLSVASSSELSSHRNSLEPSPVKVASQQVASELTKLVQGLGSKQISLTSLTKRQREILQYTRKALLNPETLPGFETAVSQIVSHAKSKADTNNQKGFNQHIYSKNSLFDFIDRVDDFIKRAPEIKQIDACQHQLQKLTTEAKRLSSKETSMTPEEIETVEKILHEIKRFESLRQAAVQSFCTSFVHVIDTRTMPGVNRLTKQETTGSSFPFFAKELMVQFDALNRLDTRYYIGGDRQNDLIPECQNVEELRVLAEMLQGSLGALFAKITI